MTQIENNEGSSDSPTLDGSGNKGSGKENIYESGDAYVDAVDTKKTEEKDEQRHQKPNRPGEPITCRPLEVKVFEGKMDKAIRMLKNRLAKEGVLKEIKRRRHYSKPSEQKRIKARDAARRRRKAQKAKRG